jgi:CRP-like cAMP-binding protein
MATQIEFIKSLPHFKGISESEITSLLKYFHEKKAERGEILFFEGEPAEALYFLVDGAVKVFKTSADGKEQIFRIKRPGESLNDVPVFAGGDNLISAEAMGPVVLNTINKSDMESILKEHPQVAFNVIRVLTARIAELVSLVEDFSFRRVTGRVAKMLLEYASVGDGKRPRLTQQEMAAMIGTAREMVGRSLKNLEDGGTIRMEGSRIIVTDVKALKEMAGLV